MKKIKDEIKRLIEDKSAEKAHISDFNTQLETAGYIRGLEKALELIRENE